MVRAPLAAVYCAAPPAAPAVGTKQGPILVIFLSVQRAMHVLARPKLRPGQARPIVCPDLAMFVKWRAAWSAVLGLGLGVVLGTRLVAP